MFNGFKNKLEIENFGSLDTEECNDYMLAENLSDDEHMSDFMPVTDTGDIAPEYIKIAGDKDVKKTISLILKILLPVLIILSVVIVNPLSRLKSDEATVFGPKTVSISDYSVANPADPIFAESFVRDHLSVDTAVYDKKTGVFRITIKPTEHIEGYMNVKLFAYQGSDLIAQIINNHRINGVRLTQEITFNNGDNVKDALSVYYTRDDLKGKNLKDWTDDLFGDNNFISFYTGASDYKIYKTFIDEFDQEQRDLL